MTMVMSTATFISTKVSAEVSEITHVHIAHQALEVGGKLEIALSLFFVVRISPQVPVDL